MPFLNRWLKPGFRHCSCAVQNDESLVFIDPHLNGLSVYSVYNGGSPAHNIDTILSIEGVSRVMEVVQVDAEEKICFDIVTCVGVVKKILRIDDITIQTPSGLYRHLIDKSRTVSIKTKGDLNERYISE